MNVILVLMLAGLIVAGLFLVLFIWAVRSGQFDDPVTPSWRILFDDLKKQNRPEESGRA